MYEVLVAGTLCTCLFIKYICSISCSFFSLLKCPMQVNSVKSKAKISVSFPPHLLATCHCAQLTRVGENVRVGVSAHMYLCPDAQMLVEYESVINSMAAIMLWYETQDSVKNSIAELETTIKGAKYGNDFIQKMKDLQTVSKPVPPLPHSSLSLPVRSQILTGHLQSQLSQVSQCLLIFRSTCDVFPRN